MTVSKPRILKKAKNPNSFTSKLMEENKKLVLKNEELKFKIEKLMEKSGLDQYFDNDYIDELCNETPEEEQKRLERERQTREKEIKTIEENAIRHHELYVNKKKPAEVERMFNSNYGKTCHSEGYGGKSLKISELNNFSEEIGKTNDSKLQIMFGPILNALNEHVDSNPDKD